MERAVPSFIVLPGCAGTTADGEPGFATKWWEPLMRTTVQPSRASAFNIRRASMLDILPMS